MADLSYEEMMHGVPTSTDVAPASDSPETSYEDAMKGTPNPRATNHAPAKSDVETSLGHKLAVTASALPEGVVNMLATPFNLTSALYNKYVPEGTPITDDSGYTAPFQKYEPMDFGKAFSADDPNAGPLGVLAQPRNAEERVLNRTGQAVGAAAAGGGLFGAARGALTMGTLAAAPASLVAAQDEVRPDIAENYPRLHFGEELGLNFLMGSPHGLWHAISPLSTENAVQRTMGNISIRSGIPGTELASAADAAKNTGLTLSQAAGKAGIANAGKLRSLEDSAGVLQPRATSEASGVLKKLPVPGDATTDEASGLLKKLPTAPPPMPEYGGGDIPIQPSRGVAPPTVNEGIDRLDNFASRMDQLASAKDGLTRSTLSKQLTSEWNDYSPTFQNAIIQRVLNVGDDSAVAAKWNSLPSFMQQSIIKSRPDVGERLSAIAARTLPEENVDQLNNFTSRMEQLASANDGLTGSTLSKKLTSEWNNYSPAFQNAVMQRVFNVGDDRALMTKWESLPSFMQQSIIKSRPDVGDRLADIASRTRAINPTPLPMEPLPPTPTWLAALKTAAAASLAAHSPQAYMAMHFLNSPDFGKTSSKNLLSELERTLRNSNNYSTNDVWLKGRPTPLGRVTIPTAAGALGTAGQTPGSQ